MPQRYKSLLTDSLDTAFTGSRGLNWRETLPNGLSCWKRRCLWRLCTCRLFILYFANYMIRNSLNKSHLHVDADNGDLDDLDFAQLEASAEASVADS